MKNYDKSVERNLNQNLSYISDHHYKILIFGGSGSIININNQILTKFICTSKINLNQSTNYLLTREKK